MPDLTDPVGTLRSLWPGRQTVRIGVTGLARSGKTILLTSLATNLLAAGAGLPTLPTLQTRVGGRLRVGLAPGGAESLPRFDYQQHLAALVRDPPHWPERTGAVSLLALDLDIERSGVASILPPRRLRLELLDYPGEWLLDLPMLGQDFATWSVAMLRRLEGRTAAASFLGFVHALPKAAPADEALALEGHTLYAAALRQLRDESGLSLLQPGRFLMPPPGPRPPWLAFFPCRPGMSPLTGLLARRYDAYLDAVRRELLTPGFAGLDRLVVLADVLSALHSGPAAFADVAAALAAVAATLHRRAPFLSWLAFLAPLWPALGGITRVAYCASKSDHVAQRQRGNLAVLVRAMVGPLAGAEAAFAIAAARCTEDLVWTLDGRPVSAVRGRVAGEGRAGRSYPGEVPDQLPDASFWAHPFLALPDFEPLRVQLDGRGGVANLELDRLLAFLLDDLL